LKMASTFKPMQDKQQLPEMDQAVVAN